jgi:signal peptidase I
VSDQQIERDARRRALAKKTLFEWIGVIGFAFVVAILIRTFFLQQFYIAGPSMETTMFSDNRVLVDKISYRFSSIDRGDVVVFDRATMNGSDVEHDDLIKRVIGLGGERVSIKNCVVLINDVPLNEPYLPQRDTEMSDLSAKCGAVDMEEVLLEPDELFLAGDNRPQSFDSRMFGPVKEGLIVGKAFVLVWPPSSWRGL